MLFLIFVTAILFGVDAHLKFTECQAEFYRKQPGNENVVFETDGRPQCSEKLSKSREVSEGEQDAQIFEVRE